MLSASLRTALWQDVLVAVGPYRPHTMIVGPADETAAFVEALRDDLIGPVCTVESYDNLDDAIDRANATRYGLQAGIFTSSLRAALDATERLEFGGVTVNEAPTFRADQMPYGGVKDSGNTREGPAWAVREMTEERLVVVQL